MMDCPNCGSKLYAKQVDVGVGMQQVSPHCCEACGWIEGGCQAPDGHCTGKICIAWDDCRGRSLNPDVYDFEEDYANAYFETQVHDCSYCSHYVDSGKVTIHGTRVYHCQYVLRGRKECPFEDD